MTCKVISIVTPCFNEQDNVEPCHAAVKALFDGPLAGYEREHVFCDNASTDGTPARLRALAAADSSVKVILNARNFGPFCSTFNGLMSTSGDAAVVLLAADLQDPPEVVAEFVAKWEQGHQVVYGIRAKREEPWLMRSVRHAYYRLVSRFSDFPIPPDVGEFQLIDRCVVDALRRFDDHYPYIRGMIASCGFDAVGVEYTWRARARGFSKNRLWHLIDQAMNGIISFNKVPLRLVMMGGLALSVLSVLYAVATLIINLLFFRELAGPGVPTLIVALFFFSGVQLFLMGFMGEYVGAIHAQVRKRPLVIERERINFGGGAE
jgi:glycosyltransferase involved in cell wall biosynthesis